jgi:hypothetical protein
MAVPMPTTISIFTTTPIIRPLIILSSDIEYTRFVLLVRLLL